MSDIQCYSLAEMRRRRVTTGGGVGGCIHYFPRHSGARTNFANI